MQSFQVDQPSVRQPLFGRGGNGWSPQRGPYEEMSHGQGWDDSGASGNGLSGWWRGLPARQRTWWKWGAGAGAAVILIVIIASSVGGTKGGKGGGSSSNAPSDPGGSGNSVQGSGNSPTVIPPRPALSSPVTPDVLHPAPTLPLDGLPTVSSSPECNWAQLYLPSSAQPARYNLTINAFVLPNDNSSTNRTWADPALDNTVQGNAHIAVRLTNASNCLVLHAGQDMTITSASWLYPNGSIINATTWRFNATWQQLTVEFSQFLGPVRDVSQSAPTVSVTGWSDEAQLGHLVLDFSYTVQEGLDGFYISRYNDSSGVTHTMAATQFESIAARKAFPCWDQPNLKAPFSVSIAAHPNATVLSNMQQDSAQPPTSTGSGLVLHTYKISPPMSTYLIAWVIGDLTSTSKPCNTSTGGGLIGTKQVNVSVYISPRWADGIGSTPDIACHALQQLTRTLGVSYTLDKLDLVGLPNFGAGAMENWGLITFREELLLYTQPDQDGRNQLDINMTIAHEITHQWFGNLVTCSDWTDLWLNEGFATYFENIGAELKAGGQEVGLLQYFFFPDTTAPALMSDAVGSTHAIASTAPLIDLTQSDSLFDDITYKKGAAVLRMLRMYLSLVPDNATSFIPLAPTNAALTSLPPAPAPLTVTAIPASVPRTNLTYLPVRKVRRLLAEQVAQLKDSITVDGQLHARHLQQVTDDYDDGASPAKLETFRYPTWQTEPLLAALHTYLNNFSFQAVNSTQLWSRLKTPALPLDTWMGPWTWNSSYPVVQVVQVQNTTQGNPGTVNITLAQLPMLNGTTCGDDTLSDTTRRWWIPVLAGVVSANDTQLQAFTMDSCTAGISLTPSNSTAPVLLNAGRYGLYHVNYTEPMWNDLISQSASLTSQNLAGLLSDAYRLTELQDMPLNINIFLKLAETMRGRSQAFYAAWSVLANKLIHMHQLLSNAAVQDPNSWRQCHNNYMVWVNRTYATVYSNLGFSLLAGSNIAERMHTRLTRPVIAEAAGRSGGDTIVSTAINMLNSTDYLGLHPDVRGVAACLYVQGQLSTNTTDATEQERASNAYEIILHQYQNASTLPLDTQRLLSALTCTRQADLQDQFLDNLTSPSFVQSGDVGSALTSLALQGGDAFFRTWNKVTNSSYFEAQLLKRWPDQGSATYSLGRPLSDMAKLFVDNSYDAAMQAFYTRNKDLLSPTFVAAYQEHTTRNMNWLATAGKQLCSYMATSLASLNSTSGQ